MKKMVKVYETILAYNTIKNIIEHDTDNKINPSPVNFIFISIPLEVTFTKTTPANPNMHPINFFILNFSYLKIKHEISIATKVFARSIIEDLTPVVLANPQ